MRRKQTERRKAALKKETIRALDQAATLSQDDLRQVAGGGYKCTYPCATQC